MQIILASGSPRRKELLSWLGLDFEVLVPEVNENVLDGESPKDYCTRLSQDKARNIFSIHSDALIIAADTVVVLNSTILGKPADNNDAVNQLRLLQGTMHEVYTGYTIINEKQLITRAIKTRVFFKEMNDFEISWYISTGEPLDKAGSYGLQGIGSLFVDRIEGSYTNVIGLPLSDLYNDLKVFGIIQHEVGRYTL